MSKGKFVKLPRPLCASEQFCERPGKKNQVIIRTLGASQGYWGRGWAVQNAVRASQWICAGMTVGVALCTKDTKLCDISGALACGEVSTWYKGRVMSNHDVKITHVWEPAR